MAANVKPGAGGDDGPENSEAESGHGHFFTKKSFHKPTYCHHCTDMLWGLIGQGYICEVCNFVVHDRCLKTVVSPCSSIAASLIKNPVAHCWSEPGPLPGHFKRKFCNVCRKRIAEDHEAISCEICEYYAHNQCQDFVVSDCKECATFVPQKDRRTVVQYHHWREGNLPINSKCLHCKKTCWSSECLAGMRCEWCGVTAHAQCYRLLPAECSFGCLREIMLPPYSVTVPRIDVTMETKYGFQKKPALPGKQGEVCNNFSEECSSSGDSKTEEEDKRSPKEKERKDKDRDPDDEIVRIFDGNSSLKKRVYRTVAVPKNAPAQVLLEAALRTFHISDNPKNYFIAETTEKENERELETTQPIRGQITSRDGKRPSVFLRYKERDPDHGYIRVYSTGLSQLTNINFKYIPVNKDTTAEEVIEKTIRKFGLDGVEPTNFSLVEVMLDRGVSEREMEKGECPWVVVQQGRKESLRQNRMTRFYIKQKEDPHGPQVALFVGNLPTGLSQVQYGRILSSVMTKDVRWSKFDVIYYEYGALVLLFDDSDVATKAYHQLRESTHDSRELNALLLPNIRVHMLPDHTVPLLVLVNVKSGGQRGMELLRSFRKLLNPHQSYDLMNGGPLPGLYVFRNVPYFKIMVCGGDGTVGWALSCLDNVGQDARCSSPPMAIVPLGTGNDLARVLRWGSGYSSGGDPMAPLLLLRDVVEAEPIKLDRWTVIMHPNEKDSNDPRRIANDTNPPSNTSEDNSKIFVMNNYFGLGIDADLCLDFHKAREENPERFDSVKYNKTVYFIKGLKRMVTKPSYRHLNQAIKLEVDGKPVELPAVQGIIILNILSWASGANLWGPEKEDSFSKPTHYDGMLEVVGVSGILHMANIQGGIRSGTRIAQGEHIRIQMLEELPVQVDGEPWPQGAGQVVVLRSALRATMLKKSKNKIKRRNTEPSLYFPPNEPLQPQSPSTDGDSGPL